MQMSADMNCFEAVRELDAAMADVIPTGMNYIVLGGIVSSAIRHPDTIFDSQENGGMLLAPNSAADPVIRENGTKRDVDILITGVLDRETCHNVKQTVHEATGGELVVSVFDFEAHDPNPSWLSKVKAGVSHRTIDENGVLRYEMYPLLKEVKPETYEPWYLTIDNGQTKINVLNPAGHILAYRMRSISGIRPKDVGKVAEMTRCVMAVPELEDAIREGDFADWLDFAEALQSILRAEIEPGDGLLFPEAGRASLVAFRWKGKLLHALESNESLVRLAQDEKGVVEKALNFFVRAK